MQKIKSYINRVVGFFGYQIVRASKTPAQEPLEYLDGFLTGLLSAGHDVRVLQCGANDGVTVDPVRNFLIQHPDNVSAVLIEPLPDVYEELKENYRDYENVTTLNIAIGPNEHIDLFRIKSEYISKYKGIIASGITSFDRNFVLRKAATFEVDGVTPDERIECFRQESRGISNIIDDFSEILGSEPFLQIDAEGFDDQVIYTVDFQRHRPIAINYEVSCLSKEKHDSLIDYLKRNGYSIRMWNSTDEIAIRDL